MLVLAALLGFLMGALPTRAQTDAPTPTPNAAGEIVVVVQPNDSLWNIAAAAGISLQELLELNALTENDFIQPGDRLIVGYGPPPVTPTRQLPPTATLPPPTSRPTQVPPRTAICLTAYDDRDQDGVYEAGEPLRAAVAFTVYDETAVVANYVTTGENEPHCIEGLSGGAYHVTRSINPDEVLTNDGEWAIRLAPGDVAHLEFGSYSRNPTATATPSPDPAAVTPSPPPVAAATTAVSPAAPETAVSSQTIWWGAGLLIMSLLVGVLSLLIWKKVRRS